MEALGGPCRAKSSEFHRLSPVDVEALRETYGVTHALLFADDPKMAHARNHWTLVHEPPPPADGSVAQGLAVFALTRRT